MKLVHYLARIRLEDGGVVRAVIDLCAGLAARGHDVTLLTFDPQDVPEAWGRAHASVPRVVQLPRRGGRLLSREGLRVALSAVTNADVLHLHVLWDPVCVQLARLARGLRLSFVVTLHGMLDDWCMAQKALKKRLFLALAVRRMLETAAAVHVTAAGEREQSGKWYPRGKSALIGYLFDVAPYAAPPGPALARRQFAAAFPPAGVPTILFLSRLHPKKGVALLIQAAALLRDRGVPFRMLIAGSGEDAYERRLRNLVGASNLSDRVVFLGFVAGTEKVSLQEAVDLFALPTSQENWGFVLMEALACGTPVVTTRGVDIWPELEESGAAKIVEQNAAALADGLMDVLRSDWGQDAARARTRSWTLAHVAPERRLEQYERMYADETAAEPTAGESRKAGKDTN